MKNDGDEAAYNAHERAAHDRCRKGRPRDNSKQWSLRFALHNTRVYFKSLGALQDMKHIYEMRFGEAVVMEPQCIKTHIICKKCLPTPQSA